jgi:hypothetical protein
MTRTLNSTRCLIGNQCRSLRTGDMWSRRRGGVVIGAARFWISWSLCRWRFSPTPASNSPIACSSPSVRPREIDVIRSQSRLRTFRPNEFHTSSHNIA